MPRSVQRASQCPLVEQPEPTDQQLRKAWREAGGDFHGPNIETGTMPEAKLLPFLRSLASPKDPA